MFRVLIGLIHERKQLVLFMMEVWQEEQTSVYRDPKPKFPNFCDPRLLETTKNLR
jgi:hypothetical protein